MTTPLPPVNRPVPIHGSPVENLDRIPIRREIRDLRSNYPKEWTLFLLGLEKFKNVDESHPLSYYQISGIHGLPYTTWPNEQWNQGKISQADPTGKDRAQWQGFCTHSSILFLPWHRPYLSLFETELRRHVQAAAEEFTPEEGGNDYLKAAKTFRLPYWDWALPSGKDNGMFPSGATEEIPKDVVFPKSRKSGGFAMNPLCSYQFGQIGKQDRSINIFPTANRTLRYPIGNNAVATKMNEQDLRDSLLDFLKDAAIPWVPAINKGKNLTERTLYLLQSYSQFAPVSSNEYFKDQGFANYGSLEDLHNALHGICGGNGHMSNPAYAAFDPIFWLHHANIDRLFAIWQALHDKGKQDQYVTTEPARNPGSSRGGTFSTSWRGQQTIDTPLTPFTISEKGEMWTSKGARTTKEFGYLYPETQPWVYPTDNDIYAQINKLYPNASLANTMKASKSRRQATNETFTARAETLLAVQKTEIKTAELVAPPAAELNQPQKILVAAVEEAKAPASRSLEDLVKDDKYLEWLVDIRAAKHSLGGNFQVHVFLGSPDDTNSTLYLADPNHVALFSTFGSSENTGCEACKEGQEIGLQVTGQIPLTIALVERYIAGMLDSITPDDVIPFLQKNLHWRVTDNGGVRGSRADVEGLLVGVVSNEVTISQEDGALPQYAPTVTPWPAATTRENGEGRGRGTGFTG